MHSDGLTRAKITSIFNDELGFYAAKRIAAALKEDPAYTPVNHKKVGRITKSHGALKARAYGVDPAPPSVRLAAVSCQI